MTTMATTNKKQPEVEKVLLTRSGYEVAEGFHAYRQALNESGQMRLESSSFWNRLGL
jgi:hypothetical protein